MCSINSQFDYLNFFTNFKAKEKHGITLEWDRRALDFLVNGYDINYGARSIKHEVERRVVNQLAVADEYGLIENGSHILITADLPPNQDEQTRMIKTESKNDEIVDKENKTYDIRLRKVIKNKDSSKVVYQDINLKMNSFGRYFLPSNKS